MGNPTFAEIQRIAAAGGLRLIGEYRLTFSGDGDRPFMWLGNAEGRNIGLYTDTGGWVLVDYVGPVPPADISELRACGYGWIADRLEAAQ